MSTASIPFTPASQPAAPGVISYAGSTPAAATSIPLPGTNTGEEPEQTPPDVVPIATPEPPDAPAVLIIATPDPAAPPQTLPVNVPGVIAGANVSQSQLESAVNALKTEIAAAYQPLQTAEDGTKHALVVDENNLISIEEVPNE